MSRPLGIAQTFELLERLKGAVREFAAREDRLETEFRGRIASERRRRDNAASEQAKWLEAERTAATVALETSRARAEGIFQQRKSHIAAALKSSRRLAQDRLDERKSRRKYELQRDLIQAKEARDGGIAAANAALEAFHGELTQRQELLAALDGAARDAFQGYGKLRRHLSRPAAVTPADVAPDEQQLLMEIDTLIERARADFERFRRQWLPRFFKHRILWLALVVFAALTPLLTHVGIRPPMTFEAALTGVGAALVLGFILHLASKGRAMPPGLAVADALGRARQLRDACVEQSTQGHAAEMSRLEVEFQTRSQEIDANWERAQTEAADLQESYPRRVEIKGPRAEIRNQNLFRKRQDTLAREHARTMQRLESEAQVRVREITASCDAQEAKLLADHQVQWRTIEADWKERITPIHEALQSLNSTATALFPPWVPESFEMWRPPAEFAHAAKFARLDLDVPKFADASPKDARLALPGSGKITVPLALSYPAGGSVLFETGKTGRDEGVAALNNIILRLLSTAPAGRLKFTIFDPVGLGQNFAGVMHLADHEEHLINGKIWTQSGQMDQRLADLNEHMEKVIQMYLRNEYATIAEYNEQAGNIAEKYHFLVVADFPANFSDTAARRLLSIANSGARCGVFTLIHWDQRHPLPQDFVPDELRKSSVCLSHRGSEFVFGSKPIPGAQVVLDPPPNPEFAIDFIHRIGRASVDSNRVEVPFNQVAPDDANLWSVETTNELRVPIGRTGATKLQYLAIGKGTRQHALLAGKTGSGKSTLFHVIVTNLALWCSPEQVEFYLIDFKKGVEFKCYGTHRLPHARVVAIESDREFGLSVLQRVDEELKRRGEMFRALGVQDLAGYKRAGGTGAVPRSLLMIDEFQEFFVEEDKIAQSASVLLDRIVRQGRAFGIHVILGSQTLGGAYTVARTTLGQMVIRIALQCNEADAYLIMDDNNPAPRLLSRPGEGIYNDAAGAKEGNSPFQVVWLSDETRDDALVRARARADRSGKNYPGPIVFEGDAPANIQENAPLAELLAAPAFAPVSAPRIWLGAPNSIKGPTEAAFQRQSGNNLLIIGQRDEAALAILTVALTSLSAQHPARQARFLVFDASAPGSPEHGYIERLAASLPTITLVKPGDLAETMNGLAEDLKQRSEGDGATDAPTTFVFFHGLQKFKKLRQEDEFSFSSGDAGANPATQLASLITEGPAHGIHVIATCDSVNNVNRFLSRKVLSEFEMRVLFQMSANDSATLIDSPRAGALGLHRAIFYNEHDGYTELFRPYALPGADWIEEASRQLARLSK